MNVNAIFSSLANFPKVSFFIVGLVVAITFTLPQDDVKTAIMYIVLIPLFFIFRFDARILAGCAVLLLGVSAVFMGMHDNYYSERLALQSYYLLVVTVSCLLIEFFIREERA